MANRSFCACFALLALTGTLRADIPPAPSPRPLPRAPRPDLDRGADAPLPPLPAQFARTRQTRSRVAFRFDGPDSQTRVRFPSALIRELPPDAPSGTTRGAWSTPARSHLITTGLALTFSVVGAGLWLTRWRNRGVVTGAMLVAVVLLGVSGCPWNDDDRTEIYQQKVGPMVPGDNSLAGKALLETDDNIDAVQFFIGRAELTRFVDRAASGK